MMAMVSHALECLVLVDDLNSMLVLLGRRPIADGCKMAVHRRRIMVVEAKSNKGETEKEVWVWIELLLDLGFAQSCHGGPKTQTAKWRLPKEANFHGELVT